MTQPNHQAGSAGAAAAAPNSVNAPGLGIFLGLTALGARSAPAFNAISLLTDILPLREDFAALLGVTAAGERSLDWAKALPGLSAFAILLFAALASGAAKDAINAAGDLLAFPDDFAGAVNQAGGGSPPG